MKNLLASWFRSLTAFENTPVKQEFSIVDPTSADPKGLNTVTLAVSPSDGQGPTMVSLFFEASGVKLFEKKYQDDQDAQTELSAIANDLNEAATLSKEGKTDEAKNLVNSLIEKYKRSSDTLVQPTPTPTMTQASQEPLQHKGWKISKAEDGRWMAEYDVMALYADSLDTLKAKIDNKVRKAMGRKLKAGVTMQNLFFDTVDEAMDFQKKTKELQGPEGVEGGKPLWEQMGGEEQVAPSNETTVEEDNELAPPSLSFDRIEKDKAKHDKDIGKRIKDQVKTEVESALEQKSASVFGPEQEELVEALKNNGRNWDEIKKIFVKDLSYNEDDTAVFLDSIRQKEEGGPAEGLPLPPKPPEDLVSPETHDKLVKEIEDKSEPKPEPLPLADEIARADNAEIRKVATSKVALNPLQEPPAVGQNPGQPLAAPVEEAPTFDSPVPPSQDTNPEPEFLEAPQAGDRVYVMGDYETGQDGFEGTMVSEYTSKGDDYAVISKDDGDNTEVALHRVVKASQKKVAQVYYEKKAAKKCPNCGKEIWDVSTVDQRLNKCWSCGQRWMDDPDEEPIESEADLEVESKGNQDVIRMFISDSFPKDKMPVWGTPNLKITKYPNGWALVNYQTPILYRANGSDVIVFNTTKYSVTTSKIQSQIRSAFAGQSVKETDEAGIYSAIDQSNLAVPEPEFTPKLKPQAALDKQARGPFFQDLNEQTQQRIIEEVAGYFGGNIPQEEISEAVDDFINRHNDGDSLSAILEGRIRELEASLKVDPELQSLHESALKLKADLENEPEGELWPALGGTFVKHENHEDVKVGTDTSTGSTMWECPRGSNKMRWDIKTKTAQFCFPKDGLKKEARQSDSAFEGDGWVRVWVDQMDVELHPEYKNALAQTDETSKIAALKEIARKLAYNQLEEGKEAAGLYASFNFDSLVPSQHDRIDWYALANPEPEDIESAQKSKVEKQAADPVPPAEGPKEIPTAPKYWKKAPEGTDREKAIPATVEQAQLIKDVESSLSSLEAIKSLVTQTKAKLAEEIRQIEEKGGRVSIEAEVNEKIQRLAKLVEATQNQMITAGDTMVRLVQDTKEHPFKPSDKWKVEKLTERLSKYEDAAKYLKQAEDGAQHLATSEEIRELYFFPRKSSQSTRLSKKANFLDTLDSVYNSVMEALKLIVGSEPKEQPTAV